jgi:hypothetical protein
MGPISSNIAWHVWRFNHVIADKGRQRFHSQELVGFVEVQIETIDANTFKELLRVSKSL